MQKARLASVAAAKRGGGGGGGGVVVVGGGRCESPQNVGGGGLRGRGWGGGDLERFITEISV